MKVKKSENFHNKSSIKGCKWSSLNVPGTKTPLSHPFFKLDEFPFPNIGSLGWVWMPWPLIPINTCLSSFPISVATSHRSINAVICVWPSFLGQKLIDNWWAFFFGFPHLIPVWARTSPRPSTRPFASGGRGSDSLFQKGHRRCGLHDLPRHAHLWGDYLHELIITTM